MYLRTVQEEAHAIAVARGSWDEPRTFGDLIALVHSKLSEALEEYLWNGLDYYPGGVSPENPAPHGVPSELADIVIRVADIAEHYEGNLLQWLAEAVVWLDSADRFWAPESFGDWIAALHYMVGEVSIRYRTGASVDQWGIRLGALIGAVNDMAAHYGIDLDAAIETKMEYNRTRNYRHGGKAL